MAKGCKRHLKRLAAPKSWGLKKSDGKFAPRSTPGPHTLVTSIPLKLILKNLLNVTKTDRELTFVVKEGLVKVNGRVRKEEKFPVGIFDIVTLNNKVSYRVFYNSEGRFTLREETANHRVVKVTQKKLCRGNIPYLYTSDGNSFRFCDQDIVVGDSVKIDNETNQIVDYLKLKIGSEVFTTHGRNIGALGTVIEIERKDKSSKALVKIQDGNNRIFTTTENFMTVIGENGNYFVNVPEDIGIKKSVLVKSNEKYGNPIEIAE